MQGNVHIIRVIIVSCLIVLFLGPVVIPVLKRLKVGQSIREEGPKSHMSKSGTPTMGGVLLILGIVISVMTGGYYSKEVWAIVFFIAGFGLVGFVDDYIKVVLKRNLGLKAWQKILGQLLFAVLLALYGVKYSVNGTKLLIPFTSIYVQLGVFYIPFTVFAVLGIVNGVNLTDGLDGLCTGVTLIVMAAFSLIANSMVSLDEAYRGVMVASAAVSGACLGFLKHNAHPAKVFMGDTGSLALGGAVAAVAVITDLTLVVPILGGIYFAEALSDIIQVAYYKRTGKRVFKMAPLHHHFEMCGWKETKVVVVFWTVTVLLAFIGIYSI